MKPVKVAIVGCGGMGKALANAVAANPDAQVIWTCDVNEAAAREAAQPLGAKATRSLGKVLADPEVTAVVIATPHHLHHGPSIRASRAGKHVFCEKPMALTSRHCRRMIEAAAQAGKKLMVGQVLRYYEPFETLRHLATSGTYGRPRAAVVWRSGLGWGLRQPWRMQPQTHGGILFEVAVHEFDLIMTILGPVSQLWAVGGQFTPKEHGVEDLTLVNCRFRDGGFGHFQHGQGDPEGKAMMKVWCEQALLSVEWRQADKVKVSWLDKRPAEEVPVQFKRKPVEHEINLWIESILEDKPVPIPGEDGLRVIRVVEAAKKSMQTGRVIRLG